MFKTGPAFPGSLKSGFKWQQIFLIPKDIQKKLDFSTINTNRIHKVSEEFKEGDADIVVIALLVIQKMKINRNDFYVIIEKKSQGGNENIGQNHYCLKTRRL